MADLAKLIVTRIKGITYIEYPRPVIGGFLMQFKEAQHKDIYKLLSKESFSSLTDVVKLISITFPEYIDKLFYVATDEPFIINPMVGVIALNAKGQLTVFEDEYKRKEVVAVRNLGIPFEEIKKKWPSDEGARMMMEHYIESLNKLLEKNKHYKIKDTMENEVAFTNWTSAMFTRLRLPYDLVNLIEIR